MSDATDTTKTDAPGDPAKSDTGKDTEELGEKGLKALESERARNKDLAQKVKDFEQREADRVKKEKSDGEEKAARDGEWQKLADDRQKTLDEKEAEIECLKAEGKQREVATLRIKATAKHELPDEFADRLRGETEDEIEADAKELAKLWTATGGAKRGSQGNPNGKATNGLPTLEQTTEEMRRLMGSRR